MDTITKEDFDDIGTWSELMGLCDDLGYDDLDYFITENARDEYICSEINEYSESWEELRDKLGSVPTGYDVYEYGGGLDFNGYYDGDETFKAYKRMVCTRLEDDEYLEEFTIPCSFSDEELDTEEFGTEEFTVSDLFM